MAFLGTLVATALLALSPLRGAGTGAPPPDPATSHYPTLCADRNRTRVASAYFDAWSNRDKDGRKLHETRTRFLRLYADAHAAIGKPVGDARAFDQRLRLLWDLSGVAHATAVSPADIKRAVGWKEPRALPLASRQVVSATDATSAPILATPTALPPRVRLLLKSVEADRGYTFWDFVSATARQVYLTPQLTEWSPACPLDVCGSCEPLTRTLILTSVSTIDLSPKPDWLLAAVAVHESAHVNWFHRPEVSRDPKLLWPAPNERKAWQTMGRFLQGLLEVKRPELRPYIDQNAPAIRAELQRARRNSRG